MDSSVNTSWFALILLILFVAKGLSLATLCMVSIIGTMAHHFNYKVLLIGIIVAMISVVFDSYITYIKAAEKPLILAALSALQTSLKGLFGIIAAVKTQRTQNVQGNSSELGTDSSANTSWFPLILLLLFVAKGLSLTTLWMVFIIGTMAHRFHYKVLLIGIIVAMISVVYDSYVTYIEAADRPVILAVLRALLTSLKGLFGIQVAVVVTQRTRNVQCNSSELGTLEKDPSLKDDEKTEV